MKKCNAVFEGGGVRGIGHVGAVCRMEQEGWQFADLAGSSAGAIVASLLAAGYTGKELKKELETLDYMRFKGKDLPDHLGIIGKSLSLLFSLGIYNTNYLESWLEGLLRDKGIYGFGDVEKLGRTLKITASDLTDKRLLVFPDDLDHFTDCPKNFSVALAVRMSVSIPIFFEPVRLKDKSGQKHLIVDGGLLSNYPLWLFDGRKGAGRPTFGFQFTDGEGPCQCPICQARPNLVDYLKAIVSTSLDAIDRHSLSAGDYERTIHIPAVIGAGENRRKISAVDFNISKEDSLALFKNGWDAADRFLRDRELKIRQPTGANGSPGGLQQSLYQKTL